MLAEDEYLGTYKGIRVRAAIMRAPGYVRGYIMRVGPNYIDARDLETGRLRLANGKVVDVSGYTHADWGRLETFGVEWIGAANLTRFVNEAESNYNVVFRRGGKLYTLGEIPPDTELLVSRYSAGFWNGDDGAKSVDYDVFHAGDDMLLDAHMRYFRAPFSFPELFGIEVFLKLLEAQGVSFLVLSKLLFVFVLEALVR